MENTHNSHKDDHDWSQKTILVVEDVDTNLMFIKAALSKTKVSIVWATDGVEAIEKVQSDLTISLILMDLRMPNMDGFMATEAIKSLRPEIPIIAQTTFTDELDIDRVFNVGCDDFLSKPIRLDYLIQTLSKYLD